MGGNYVPPRIVVGVIKNKINYYPSSFIDHWTFFTWALNWLKDLVAHVALLSKHCVFFNLFAILRQLVCVTLACDILVNEVNTHSKSSHVKTKELTFNVPFVLATCLINFTAIMFWFACMAETDMQAYYYNMPFLCISSYSLKSCSK